MKTLIALACLCAPAYGAHCRQQVVVANQSAVFIPHGFIAVPFAVPVGVPSYVQYQAVVSGQGSVASEETTSEVSRALAAERVLAAPATLVAQTCVKCHSGPNPKSNLDLSGELAPAVRLKMIARILADDPAKRMPKGKPLDAQAIGLLIQELSRTAKTEPNRE